GHRSATGQEAVIVAAVQPGPCPGEEFGALAAGEPYPDRAVLGAPGLCVDIAAGGPALGSEDPTGREALGRLARRLVGYPVGPDQGAVVVHVLGADHGAVDRGGGRAAAEIGGAGRVGGGHHKVVRIARPQPAGLATVATDADAPSAVDRDRAVGHATM